MVITAKVVFFMERAQDWFKVSNDSSQSFYVRLVDLSHDVEKAGGATLAPDKSLIDQLDRCKDFEIQLTEKYLITYTLRLIAEYSRYAYIAYQQLRDILPQSILCKETREDIVRVFAHLLS